MPLENEPTLHIKGHAAHDSQMLDYAKFRARTEERLDQHDDEIERSRVSRESFAPRFEVMEKAVLELTQTIVPKLTVAVEAMTKEMIEQTAYRKLIVKILSWSLATATAIGIAFISSKLAG